MKNVASQNFELILRRLVDKLTKEMQQKYVENDQPIDVRFLNVFISIQILKVSLSMFTLTLLHLTNQNLYISYNIQFLFIFFLFK